MGRENHLYGVYGVQIRSDFPLALPQAEEETGVEIKLRLGTADEFPAREQTASWYQHGRLKDGSAFVRWAGLGQFLVSARGDDILCWREPEANPESFQVYLLGQALSFALVQMGLEPLHGTAIVLTDGEAIVLLGNNGFGKSTLAASFLQAGCSLLTDDLLVVRMERGCVEGFPGPPRIKLFPDAAARFLADAVTGVPMNVETQKHVIPIPTLQRCARPVPIRAIYALAPPQQMRRQRRVRIEALSGREAFLALVSNTFNSLIVDSERLERQLVQTTRLLESVPVRALSYPRSLSRLGEVREAIIADSRAGQRIAV